MCFWNENMPFLVIFEKNLVEICMKTLSYIFVAFFLAIACIPIEDKLNPKLEKIDFGRISKTYQIQDTLIVKISYRDNQQLDCLIINIRPIQANLSNAWQPSRVVQLEGKGSIFYTKDFKFIIPTNAPQGFYTLTTRFYDFSKNASMESTDSFEVIGDKKSPVIEGFEVTEIPKKANSEDFLACRNDVLVLNGKISDNIGLSLVEVSSVPNIVASSRSINATNVSLSQLFGRDLKINSNAADGTVATVTVRVQDASGNDVRKSFKVEVNCDDQAPQVLAVSTSPSIEENNEVRIVEGGSLKILQGTISDNRLLQEYSIRFNLVNALPNIVLQRNNLQVKTVNLADALKDIEFKLPSTAKAGDNYEWVLLAKDTSNKINNPPFRLLIAVQRDAQPKIFVTNRYINGTEVTADTVSIKATQVLRIEGKIDDDSPLSYLRILWGQQGRQQTILNLEGSKITTLPFDFSDPLATKLFVVPANAQVDSLYVLTILVKDFSNTEVQRSFYFKVVP